MNIRKAQLSDADSLNEINESSLGYDYPLEETKKQLEELLQLPDEQLLVFETQGRVSAYIHAGAYRTIYAPKMINILALAVHKDFHGSGQGRLLMNAAEEWAKTIGAAGIRLSSGENRTEAHRFYEHIGFIKRKNQANYYKIFS
ncbi:N-acetyltransferase family protein [Enterococcus sp. LJL128]